MVGIAHHWPLIISGPADIWVHLARQTLEFLKALALTLAPIVALEIILPRPGPRPSLISRLRAVGIWITAAPVSVVISDFVGGGRAAFNIKPLLEVPALPPFVRLPLAILLSYFVGDFIYYWYHRAAHKWFWPIHGVHHAIRELSAVTSYDHVIEWILIALFYSIPVAFLVADPYSAALMGGTLGYYLHSNTRFNFGPLGYVIQDNRYHRIHHSLKREHWNKNFCVFVTIWDVLFGTACFDGMREWPEVGVEGEGEIGSIGAFWLRPFRWGKGAQVEGSTAVASADAVPVIGELGGRLLD